MKTGCSEALPRWRVVRTLLLMQETGDMGAIPGLGRSPGGRHGNPLQYSCLENPMDRGAWRAIVHGIPKSWTRLKRLSMHAHRMLRMTLKPRFAYLAPALSDPLFNNFKVFQSLYSFVLETKPLVIRMPRTTVPSGLSPLPSFQALLCRKCPRLHQLKAFSVTVLSGHT